MKYKGILANKKLITIFTVIMYVLSMLIFETLYCNTSKIIDGENINYNFSICRMVIYILFFILYFKFKDRFIDKAIKANENKYKRIFIYLSIVATIFATVISTIIIMWNSMYTRALAITLIAMLMGIVFLIYVSNDLIKNIIVVVFSIGVVFCITTKFNHEFDEKKHFMSAVNISYFNFDYVNNPITDLGIEKLPQLSKYTTIDDFLKNDYVPEKSDNVQMEDVASTPASYSPVLYVIPGLGIAIARLLGGSVIDVYILGRIFNLILYGALACATIKILPCKKNIFTVIFLLPISLLLAASYSIDGLCIALVSLFIAYCLKLKLKKDVITLKDFFTLLGMFILLLLAKSMAYIAVAFIALILPVIQTLKRNKKYLPIIILVTLIFILLLGLLLIYTKNTKVTSDIRGGDNINVANQLENLKENPLFAINVIGTHFRETLLNYNWISLIHSQAFFGSYFYIVVMPMLLFLLYVSLTEDDYHFKIRDRIIMISSFLLTFIITSMVLYLSFTEVGSLLIGGYQTRYILPILPLILMCISTKKVKNVNSPNRNMNICITSAAFIIIGIAQVITV